MLILKQERKLLKGVNVSFQDSAQSWQAKTHTSKVPLPVFIGIALLVFFVLVLAFQNMWGVFSSDTTLITKEDSPQGTPGEDEGLASSSGQETEEMKDTVFVHVGGAVSNPGVYELLEGSRVQEAVQAAGGFTEEAAFDGVNLARCINDGEHIVIPTQAELEGGAGTAGGAGEGLAVGATGSPSSGQVNINSADAAELISLPGIGEVTAGKIIQDREKNGPFKSIEEIKRIAGIGDKKFEQLHELICV